MNQILGELNYLYLLPHIKNEYLSSSSNGTSLQNKLNSFFLGLAQIIFLCN